MNLIVFDIDGTMFLDNKASSEAFKNALLHLYDIMNYSTIWDNYRIGSDIGILRYLYKEKYKSDLSWDELNRFQLYYYNEFVKICLLTDNKLIKVNGLEGIIDNIYKSDKWCLAIYSGGMKKVALKKLDIYGITERKYPISTAEDGLLREEIFKSTVYKAKVIYNKEYFDNIILVGDSYQDIRVSKKLSIPMIGITTTMKRNDFLSAGISHTVDDYVDYKCFNNILSFLSEQGDKKCRL